jgi:hypothetical protein
MSVEITGIVKYARHMQGKSAEGKDYEFFSFVVLDPEEGNRWPLQLQSEHPQFQELVAREKDLMDAQVKVVVRAFSAGLRKDKDSGKTTPQARFYAKEVKVLQAAPTAGTR